MTPYGWLVVAMMQLPRHNKPWSCLRFPKLNPGYFTAVHGCAVFRSLVGIFSLSEASLCRTVRSASISLSSSDKLKRSTYIFCGMFLVSRRGHMCYSIVRSGGHQHALPKMAPPVSTQKILGVRTASRTRCQVIRDPPRLLNSQPTGTDVANIYGVVVRQKQSNHLCRMSLACLSST